MTDTVQRHGSDRAAPLAVALAAQLVLGLGLGIALGFIGLNIGGRFFAGDPSGLGDIVARVAGAMLSYPLGVALGVSLIGRLLRQPGAVWAAILGGYGGSGGVFIVAQIGLNGNFYLMWSLFVAFGLFAATAAYHLGARRSHSVARS